MPFMKGRAPIRRTLKYLESSTLNLNKSVKIITVNYNVSQKSSQGVSDFVFWNLSQLQYKNPDVQIAKFKNMTPSPFIQFFFDNGKKLVMDVHDRTKEEIHDHIQNSLCKSSEELKEEKIKKALNPASFGYGAPRWCICEVQGQVPCPGYIPLPKEMRGKYKAMAADAENED